MKALPFPGVLRAAINLGNPILATRPAGATLPVGVSVDLARSLADRLGLALELHVVDAAARSVHAVETGLADIGFFAIDPERGRDLGFTLPYVQIDGCYLVREGSAIVRNEDVDRPGHRVTVGRGSAYDLHLTRHLRQAEIVRAPTSPAVVDHFIDQGLEVAAGVRQQLESDARRLPGLRLLPGSFMQIRQALGFRRAVGPAAERELCRFIEDAKSSGLVARRLAHHGHDPALAAPLPQLR